MGCCASSTAKQGEYSIPPVKRKPSKVIPEDASLPFGIKLTGGGELRKQGLTGKGIRVGIIDSGIDADHPGFNGRVVKKVWYREGTPLSKDDHGTHVAGTVHLMAPDAEIYDYRVFGRTGSLPVDKAIAEAIRAAADVNCQVVNMSLGGPLPNPEIRAAVQYAASKGVIMVCAAGNEGDNNPLTNELSYPAAYEECISIAAVSKKKGFPVAVFSNSNAQVDYSGIGVDVVSFKPGGGFQEMSGTSMASPHVAGLCACLMTDGRIQGNDALRKILDESHAIDIATEGRDNATGIGFLSYLDEAAFDQLLPRKEGLVKAQTGF